MEDTTLVIPETMVNGRSGTPAYPPSWEEIQIAPEHEKPKKERLRALWSQGYTFEEAEAVERLEAIENTLIDKGFRLTAEEQEILRELDRHLRSIDDLVRERVRLELLQDETHEVAA